MISHKIKKGSSVFIAPGSTVLGRVSLGNRSSVWFGAVLRGDSDEIVVESGSNVQDNAVLHVDPGFPLRIGKNCTIGHGAIVHGATLSDHVLVGMNAVILNGAQIGAYTIIGANALVTANTIIPEGSMVLGSPAKVIRLLNDDEKKKIKLNAEVYVEKAKEYMKYYSKKIRTSVS